MIYSFRSVFHYFLFKTEHFLLNPNFHIRNIASDRYWGISSLASSRLGINVNLCMKWNEKELYNVVFPFGNAREMGNTVTGTAF